MMNLRMVIFTRQKKVTATCCRIHLTAKALSKKVVNDSIIIIDRVKSTNDYYIHVLFNIDVGADFVLNDNKNSEFNIYDDKIVSEERVVNCIACIEYSKDCTLNINGTIVDFD